MQHSFKMRCFFMLTFIIFAIAFKWKKIKMKSKLISSALGIIILIPLGLFSRHINWLPSETGDALWAMMMFCIWRFLLINRNLNFVAIISLICCYAVEFSQLITWQWLVELRKTFIGHMILGQGFLWIDLLAYTIGIACIWLVFRKIEK